MIGVFKQALSDFFEDDAPQMAAALSYYTAFALPPLLILVTTIAGAVWDLQAVQGRLVEETSGLLGPRGGEQIRTMLRLADRPGAGGPLTTVLSVAALLFGATGAFAQLQKAMNRTWEVRRGPDVGTVRSVLITRVLSFAMVLVIAFLLLVSLVLSAVLSSAGQAVAALLPGGLGTSALTVLDASLSLLGFTLLFMALYRVLPDVDIGWRTVWHGALLTTALFVAGKFLLGLYLGRVDPGSAYGAAGSLAVLLLWIYYSAVVVLFGAELTQAYAARRGRAIAPGGRGIRLAGDEE